MGRPNEEAEIRKDHEIMETIRRHKRDYHERTRHMNEDEKAVYDDALKRKYKEVFGDG
ncbi:MAG: hypothetical protein OIN85_01000 [Candidatus Methanoperedens sp.]|nr:hypothetical protein [Candidatus Methanoperedens sp.]